MLRRCAARPAARTPPLRAPRLPAPARERASRRDGQTTRGCGGPRSRAAGLVGAALALICVAGGEARADDWWGADKARHLGVGLALGAAAHGGLRLLDRGREARPTRLLLGCWMAALPGLAKEIYDDGQPGNAFSGKDLLWSTVGAVIGNGLVLGLELLLQRLGRPGRGARTAPAPGS